MEKEHIQKKHIQRKLRRYLSVEIGIEYKACLYFFAILFFYAMYLVLQGVYEAKLLYMAEMICMTYGMGYLQVLVLGNFDEAESFSGREFWKAILCTALYTGASWVFGWYGRSLAATAAFAGYCLLLYICACLVNRMKRDIDTEQLNVMLQAYRQGGKGDGKCDRDEESDEEIR